MMLQLLFQMQITTNVWCFPTLVANQNTYHNSTWTLVLCKKNQRVWIDTCCNPALLGTWSFQRPWKDQDVLQVQSGQRALFEPLGSGAWQALGVNRQGHRSTESETAAFSHCLVPHCPCASTGIHVNASWHCSGSPSGPVIIPLLQD